MKKASRTINFELQNRFHVFYDHDGLYEYLGYCEDREALRRSIVEMDPSLRVAKIIVNHTVETVFSVRRCAEPDSDRIILEAYKPVTADSESLDKLIARGWQPSQIVYTGDKPEETGK